MNHERGSCAHPVFYKFNDSNSSSAQSAVDFDSNPDSRDIDYDFNSESRVSYHVSLILAELNMLMDFDALTVKCLFVSQHIQQAAFHNDYQFTP